MITSLEVSHYKSLLSAKIKLGAINVIVGPNGSGKSNLIDALSFLHDCVVSDIDTAITRRHGIDSIRQWSKTRPYNIVLHFTFASAQGNGRYQLVLSSNRGAYVIVEEQGFWSSLENQGAPRDGTASVPREVHFNRNQDGIVSFTVFPHQDKPEPEIRVSTSDLFLNRLPFAAPGPAYVILRRIFFELDSFSTYTIYPNTLRQPQIIAREAILAEDGSNLATVLKRINSNSRYKQSKDDLLSALKVVLPIATDILIRSAGGYYVPVIRVTEPNGDVHDFNLSQISDGTLRVLGLLAAFYQPIAPNKIAVEEPEQMIHPGALPILVEAVKDFVEKPLRNDEKSRQAFLTTHSPTLLDAFDASDIVWTYFRDGATQCGKVSARQIDLIKRQLFSAGEILLTEGFF